MKLFNPIFPYFDPIFVRLFLAKEVFVSYSHPSVIHNDTCKLINRMQIDKSHANSLNTQRIYRVAKMLWMPQVAGLFPQKDPLILGLFCEK